MNKRYIICAIAVLTTVAATARPGTAAAVPEDSLFIDGRIAEVEHGLADMTIENRGVYRTPEMMTQSVASVSGDAVRKNSSVNIGETLYGLIPGLTVKQNTGWQDSPTFIIRGGGSFGDNAPLVVVDGIPRSLEYLHGVDIESISVLKDGPATALWGVTGANGVILVTTRQGEYSSMDIDVDYTFGMGYPVNQPEFVDGYTFALMKNEALYYDGLALEYDAVALQAFRDGSNPDLYPNVDWQKAALRNNTFNHQLNLSARGGGKRLRYYCAINYNNDQGILDNSVAHYSERYDAPMQKYNLSMRLNMDADITKSTKLVLHLYGMLGEDKRPNTDEYSMFAGLYDVPASAFPIKTSTGLWGGNSIYAYNPIARIADVGYFRTDERTLQADMRLMQDLSALTKGLKAELGIAYDNSALYRETGSKTYSYETVARLNEGPAEVRRDVYGTDSALDITNGGLYSQYMQAILDARISYDRTFGRHAVSGSLQYRRESYIPMGQNNTRKRQSYIFTAGYGYDGRYLLDVVVNYAGTSVLSKGDKYRTYPGVSAAWVISNEPFMKDSNVVDHLKLRASYGRSGLDVNVSYALDKQYWVGESGYYIRDNPGGASGLKMGKLPVEDLTLEYVDMYNVGLEMQLAKKFSFTAEAYYNQRRDILMGTSNIYSSVIGTETAMENIGAVDTKGVELGLMWDDSKRDGFNYYIGGTLSLQRSNIIENAEGYVPYPYLSQKGDRLGQLYGLEAIGYFSDQADIDGSPAQMFSEVRPGDIKYKDQNGDDKIDSYDVVPIGHSSTIPGLYYGIQLGFEIKGFAVDMVFQGTGQFSQMLNTKSVYQPMRNNNSNLSKWYTEDNVRWTEQTKDMATLPRLSTLDNANNYQTSTQWLVDGSFFKLRNLSISYTLPKKWSSAMKMDKFMIYIRGNNLFSIDKVKYLNCEDLSVNYPDLMSVYAGININF